MRLFLLSALTMTAFAANSLLNRLALSGGDIGPAQFATIRTASGAAILLLLLAIQTRAIPKPTKPNLVAVIGLAAYMICFSFAYVSLDVGVGALIHFGMVQVTMFSAALWERERPPIQRWIGIGLAMLGLTLLSIPSGEISINYIAAFLMVLASIGWAAYSLVGRSNTDPVRATTWNFVYALPFAFLALLIFPVSIAAQPTGILLAVISGSITSGLGYALWYAIMPQLGATKGGLTQLSAPVIALILGALFLSETITLTAIASASLIIMGIAAGMIGRKAK